MKKVLLVIVDALATRVVESALGEGRLPNLQQLVDRGLFRPQCISIFPSITPAATCSLVTGSYPREHRISGAYWYDEECDEVAYFGDDLPAIMNEGIDAYLHDFQIKLNMERLQAPTLFEQIEQHGHLRDAVINYLWYRGTVPHEISVPAMLKITLGASFEEFMQGPHLMYLGDFVSTPLCGTQRPSARGGITRRFGFHDESSTDYLLELAKQDSLPDFTLAYFPNNDFVSHTEGPKNALATVQGVDWTLGKLFELQGGIDNFLGQHAILLTGDHSQCDMNENSAVDLNEVLADFQLADAGKPWQEGEDLLVCPNMRSAQIYLRPWLWKNRQQVIDCLLECQDVDQVIWCDQNGGLTKTPDAKFHVQTRDRGNLVFHAATENDPTGFDEYGTPWSWQGDLSAVDAKTTSEGKLSYRDYPNAFERLAAAFFDQSANLWVTARVGKEFHLPRTSAHSGGSHGALHALDSTSPLIAAGIPQGIDFPSQPRIVDIAPLCLQMLELDPSRYPGESHILESHS